MSEAISEWSAKIADWNRSGLNISAWCRKNAEGYHRFLYWRQRLKELDQGGQPGKFVELRPATTPISLVEQFFIVEYVRPKYVSKASPDFGVATAALPDAIIPRCPADESLLAYILTSKFADHLPLYRLAEIMQRSEVKISRQTLSNWVITLGSPCHQSTMP